jgi:16S rRNA (adenine1518-N6/adenine1519-N6)-dimethyltransferase
VKRQRRTPRGLGQNFLVDRPAIERILDALAPTDGDAVLEIGPGRAALTEKLLTRVTRIAAVELDPALAATLRTRFPADRLLLIEQDVLRLSLATVAERLGLAEGARLTVVGNLPYSISKPLAMRFVEQRRLLTRAVLMFQKEVADRLVAHPGSRAYGPLTVLTGLTFDVERLFDLGPGSFRPRPKVDSTVTRWTPRADDPLDAQLERSLRLCLTACFASRRRTLRNNLRHALGSTDRVETILDRAGLDGGARAEQLEPAQFVRLAREWPLV